MKAGQLCLPVDLGVQQVTLDGAIAGIQLFQVDGHCHRGFSGCCLPACTAADKGYGQLHGSDLAGLGVKRESGGYLSRGGAVHICEEWCVAVESEE